jgi:hypothetical protein
MLTMKVSVAAAILAATAAAGAGAGCLVTLATTQVNVAMHCPVAADSRGFPPMGEKPSLTGGKQW